jgi:ribosomal protein S7
MSVYTQAVDVSPLRRVNQAIYLMTTGVRRARERGGMRDREWRDLEGEKKRGSWEVSSL